MAVLNVFDGVNYVPVGGSSGGLSGTGGFYATWSSDPLLSNEKVITAGTSVSIDTDSTTITINSPAKDYASFLNMRTAHLLNFALVERNWYIAGNQTATALGANNVGVNTAFCIPFMANRFIKVDSMAVNMTAAGSATSILSLGIYTNSADECLFPFQAVSTSGFLTGTNQGIVAFNPAITLTANNLYWFVWVGGRATVNMRTVAIGDARPIFGLDSGMGVAPGIGINIFMTLSSLLPATMPGSGNVMLTLIPAIGIRGSI